MLKTSNKGGKFDIVFEHSPDFDETAKLSGNRATSAGRRKNNEWKSKVLPKKNLKEPQLKNIKQSKASQLRSSTIAKKYERKKKDEKLKQTPIPEDTVTHDDVEVKEQEQTEIHTRTPVQENETKYDDRQDNLKSESIGKPIERRSTYTFGDNGNSGMISNELLNQIQEELKNDEQIAEPSYVPGLNIDTTPNKSNGSFEKSPNSTLDTSREDDIRKLQQTTPNQIYDPWGKPGAGAPISNSDGNIRTHRNVKMLQSEKEKDHQVHRVVEKSPREAEVSKQAQPSPPSTSYGKPSVHARGKGKQAHELSDIDKKKAKHFEHQQAIAAQVEEKRLQKQLEKERKLKEEQEAEERYQKQQEIIQKRLDDERQKEKEKQEAKLKKQMLLEENIRKAQEEAKKAKDDARKARMQKAQSESPQSPKPQQPCFKRVLHSENDTIRSSQSYEDNTVLEEFNKLYNGGSQSKENSPRTFKNTSKNEETYRKIPSKRNSPDGKSIKKENKVLKSTAEERQSQIMDDYLVPFHRSDTEEMYESRTPEVDNDSFIDDNKQQTTKKGRNKKEKVLDQFDPPNNNDDEEPVHDRARNKKKTKKQQPKSKSPPPPVKKSSHPTSLSRNQNNSTTRESVASPSTKRQQEILNRLAELRAGLKQKERECQATAWSR